MLITYSGEQGSEAHVRLMGGCSWGSQRSSETTSKSRVLAQLTFLVWTPVFWLQRYYYFDSSLYFFPLTSSAGGGAITPRSVDPVVAVTLRQWNIFRETVLVLDARIRFLVQQLHHRTEINNLKMNHHICQEDYLSRQLSRAASCVSSNLQRRKELPLSVPTLRSSPERWKRAVCARIGNCILQISFREESRFANCRSNNNVPSCCEWPDNYWKL